MTFSVSGYTRRENDNYQTVDTRCIEALLSAVQLTAPILAVQTTTSPRWLRSWWIAATRHSPAACQKSETATAQS